MKPIWRLLMNRINFAQVRAVAVLAAVFALSTACSQVAKPSKPVYKVATKPAQAETIPSMPAALMLTAPNQQQFAKAKRLMQQQNFSQAAALLHSIVSSQAGFAGVWYNLAVCQWQLQQLNQAETSLQQALTVGPKHSVSYSASLTLLGVLAREQGQFSQAEQLWLQAIQVSDAAAAHKNLGILYELYLGQLSKAQWHYQRYFDLSQDSKAQLWLTLIERQLAATGNQNAEESL
jgi:tetratricopeptide (TPR) repeat protein